MNLRPLRILLSAFALSAAARLPAQASAENAHGFVDENGIYHAPGGYYRIAVPVLPELGGEAEDTAAITTFRDDYGTHIVIACLPFEPAFRAEYEKRGRKEFLAWFFAQHVQPEFQKSFPGTTAESAKYISSIQDGSLLVMNLIPGGTAFGDALFLKEGETVPLAKRGSLLFVKNDRIFILTLELYERIIYHDTFKKTPAEEDALLRKRITDVLAKMTFPTPATTTPAATTPAAPATPAPAASSPAAR